MPRRKQRPSHPCTTYFFDSRTGNDAGTGTSPAHAWRTLAPLKAVKLQPGDSLEFKRGSSFDGPLFVTASGTPARYIVLTAYGDRSLSAPAFTNPVFREGNFGNCIRLQGNYILVENLYFYHTPAVPPGFPAVHFLTVWQMGAVYVDKNAHHCVIRDNEFRDCVAGIRSYGPYTLIADNFLHGCNRVLEQWSWGPLGIWLGGDHQIVTGNRIFNYRAEDPRIHWPSGIGGGADGGAMEIDDARYDKSDITIDDNYTRDCQGFLEVTAHDLGRAAYRDFRIHHNISDDYQQFTALWAGSHCSIDNNTIIRRKVNANDWGVFNIAGDNAFNKIRDNIIITDRGIRIFNAGLDRVHHPHSVVEHNLYYAVSGKLDMGLEGPGVSPVFANPLLVDLGGADKPDDFALTPASPAIGQGLDLGYHRDFSGATISRGIACDLGALEYRGPRPPSR
jgi:hypothetical protein